MLNWAAVGNYPFQKMALSWRPAPPGRIIKSNQEKGFAIFVHNFQLQSLLKYKFGKLEV